MMGLGVWIWCAAVWHKDGSGKLIKGVSLVAAVSVGFLFTMAGK